tara:strand:+ start:4936 stop:5418 length:483 start_codon:yes stop_codon:yes gene_type:complete
MKEIVKMSGFQKIQEMQDCLNKNCSSIIKKSNAHNKKLTNQYLKRSKNWKKTYNEAGVIQNQRSKCSLKHCINLASPLTLKIWKADSKKYTSKEEKINLKNFINTMNDYEKFLKENPKFIKKLNKTKKNKKTNKKNRKNKKTNKKNRKIRKLIRKLIRKT